MTAQTSQGRSPTPGKKKTPWAIAQEWENRRDRITELYNKHKLAEVKEIMEGEGFFATERMYKYRINQWQLHKNVKKQELVVMAHKCVERGRIKKNSQFRIGKIDVSVTRLLESCRKRGLSFNDILVATPPGTPAHLATYTPVTSPLCSPSWSSESEKFLRLMRTYVTSRVEDRTWITEDDNLVNSRDPNTIVRSDQIVGMLLTSVHLFDCGLYVSGGSILRRATAIYEASIRSELPSAVMILLQLIGYIQSVPEILDAITKHMYGLSEAMFGSYHPLSQILRHFFRQRNLEPAFLDQIFKCISDAFTDMLGSMHTESIHHRRAYLQLHQTISPIDAETSMRRLVGPNYHETKAVNVDTFRSRLCLIQIYFENGNVEEGLPEFQDFLKDIEESTLPTTSKYQMSSEAHRYYAVHLSRGDKHDLAESHMRTAIELHVTAYGSINGKRLYLLILLEKWLLSWGKHDAAMEVLQEVRTLSEALESVNVVPLPERHTP